MSGKMRTKTATKKSGVKACLCTEGSGWATVDVERKEK